MKGSRGAKSQMKKATLDLSRDNAPLIGSSLAEIGEKMLKQGMLPKDAMGINDNTLEGIYAQAYRLYNTGKYTEAVHLFRMLVLVNTTEPKYLLGLAACFHMLKEYKSAIETYTMCSLFDPQSPIPYYHSSDCFIQMKDYISAMVCLELAIRKADDKPEFAKLKERASLSFESLKKQQQPGTSSKAE